MHPRQVPVQDDDVVAGERGDLHGRLAVVGDVDRQALVPQAFRDAVGQHLLIFNYQYPHVSIVLRPR